MKQYVIKNKADYGSLYQQDYYKTQGLAFIMLVSALIRREFEDSVKAVKGKSAKDCFLDSRMVKADKRRYQLRDIIQEKIESGYLLENDRILSERELCNTYGLSRSTVRQAIQEHHLWSGGHLAPIIYPIEEHRRFRSRGVTPGIELTIASHYQTFLDNRSYTFYSISCYKGFASKLIKISWFTLCRTASCFLLKA